LALDDREAVVADKRFEQLTVVVVVSPLSAPRVTA